ncbi:polyphosphate kinase 2 [Flavobacteriaceae bacterium]|nr:polyphosphate kinase 2 [Flavobacteriaceae bacterium]MDB4591057.1 polyphosphate kinase 2 [Flavobacteriaceae bacterium]
MLTIENFKSLENGDITKKQFLELIKSNSSLDKLEEILYNLEYEDQLYKLQSELVNLQEWVSKNKKRVCIIFEGRDAAGKGGAIRRMTQHLNPRSRRVVALAKPTEIEQGQWYFRRYIKEMPNPGELVFFDRSWYNRAVVEPVMGFCTQEQYNKFMIQVSEFEQMLNEDGIILIKFWFSVTKDEQLRRFKSRLHSPLKKWKFSQVDQEGQNKWDLYTHYKDQMFAHTHTTYNPWIIIKTNNKKEARLESLRYVLSRFDYDAKGNSGITLLPDPNIVQSYH